ncbi:MAG: hypothetical protein ACK5NG_01160 [Chthoniobacterales bacterium]
MVALAWIAEVGLESRNGKLYIFPICSAPFCSGKNLSPVPKVVVLSFESYVFEWLMAARFHSCSKHGNTPMPKVKMHGAANQTAKSKPQIAKLLTAVGFPRKKSPLDPLWYYA